MARYKLKYDKAKLEMEIPEEDILKVIIPNTYEHKFSTDKEVVIDALQNPIDAPLITEMFHKGETVCLLVNDITRLTKSEVFVPLIIDELNKVGIIDEDITILFANGLHKQMNEIEMRTIVGNEVYNRVNIVQHDGINGKFELAGTTSSENEVYVNTIVKNADKVIMTGGIIMHHLAGYGGGRKDIIPGCAKQDTIFYNHRMMVNPAARAGNIEGNPIHKDLMEACSLINPDYIVNVILDHEGNIAGAVAGNWITAWEAGCRIADSLYKVPIEQEADLVIASSGGFPKDIDLRQSKKGYYNAQRAVKQGGVIICLAGCDEGISREGDPFESWLEKYKTLDEVRKEMMIRFDIGGLNAYRTREVQKRARLILITKLDVVRLKELNVEAYHEDQFQEIIDKVREELGGHPSIIVMEQAGLTLPELQ
ncbi:MAG: hypothetical protein K0Q47_232 [Sedimentibacter sp.]|jgi:nickel-dependent lactate racemase|nr:hypothetical protein [Sedimentibacter sp.]